MHDVIWTSVGFIYAFSIEHYVLSLRGFESVTGEQSHPGLRQLGAPGANGLSLL